MDLWNMDEHISRRMVDLYPWKRDEELTKFLIIIFFFFLRTPPTPHKIKAKSDVMLGQSLYLTIWLNISIIQQHPTVFANISWETANRNPTDSLSTTASYQRKASPSPTASGTTCPVKTNDWPCIKILYVLRVFLWLFIPNGLPVVFR